MIKMPGYFEHYIGSGRFGMVAILRGIWAQRNTRIGRGENASRVTVCPTMRRIELKRRERVAAQ